MAAGGEFVDGWVVAQVLGEGAYGEVRLLVHARSGASVALKSVRLSAGEAGAAAAREAALQRALRHPHVLRCLGARTHQDMHHMFLEYAEGGELFDRIEPDVGMSETEARRYWRQLLSGLGYLHERGVAHRDIKPENLLLDHNLDLKISDFGMATIFRHGARERLLTRACGTEPYAAPEVLRAGQQAPYRAAPADAWGAGVVLLAVLAGELPWERARESDPRFAAWSACAARGDSSLPAAGPWRKLAPAALALLRRALHPDPQHRAALPALAEHRWTTHSDAQPAEAAAPASRLWWSQPCGGAGGAAGAGGDGMDADAGAALSAADMEALCRSQPAHADDMLLNTQYSHLTQQGLLSGVRLTRLVLAADAAAARAALGSALAALHCTWRAAGPALLVAAGDERMRAWLWPAPGLQGGTVLELRRERGCGLAFRRRFLRMRDLLQHLLVQP